MAWTLQGGLTKWFPCLSTWGPWGCEMAQRSSYYTSQTIQKARRALRHVREGGRHIGSGGDCQCKKSQGSCTIPSVVYRLYRVRRYMADVWLPEQLSWEAARVPAEVPQKVTRWETCLKFTKHLDIKSCWHGTFYLLLWSSFPQSFLASWKGF